MKLIKYVLILIILIYGETNVALGEKSTISSKANNEVIDLLKKADKVKNSLDVNFDDAQVIGRINNSKIYAVTGRYSTFQSIMLKLGEYFSEEAAKIEIQKIGLYVINNKVGLIGAGGENNYEINNNSKFEFLLENDDKKLIKITMDGVYGGKKNFYYTLRQIQNRWKIVDEVDEAYTRPYENGIVAIRSSSNLYDYKNKVYYGSLNIWDKNPKTCWAKGVDGDGIGEWLDFAFSYGQEIKSIQIINGYAKSEAIYQANNRVKKLKISFDDGTSFDAEFEDGQMDFQSIQLLDAKKVERIRLTILEVYPGTKYHDTCISEVGFK